MAIHIPVNHVTEISDREEFEDEESLFSSWLFMILVFGLTLFFLISFALL